MGFAVSSKTSFCDRTTRWVLLQVANQAFFLATRLALQQQQQKSGEE
jgi:hypothetical protein